MNSTSQMKLPWTTQNEGDVSKIVVTKEASLWSGGGNELHSFVAPCEIKSPFPLIFEYLVQYTYSPGMDRNKCLKLLRSVSPIGLPMSYHLPRRSWAYQSLLIKLILTVVIYHSLTIIMGSSLAGVRPRPDWSHICMYYHHYLHHQNQKQKQS